MKSAGIGDSIKVFVRVRPFNDKEKSSQSCVIVDGSTIQMKDKQADHRFSFDSIFEGESTQEEVYSRVGHEVVQSAFEGFNGTVFAYGQTSSGKTHTCIGPDYMDKQKKGILPRMVGHIYEKIKQEPTYIEFRIKISMVQIYMEKIKDLLDPSKSDLKIREKAGKGIYIQDVTEQYVASYDQTISIIKRGIVNRSVGQTLMNDTSSRSHMAFIITLYQNNLKDASAKSGKIILVDLAGSEKISKTGAEGKLLDEAKQINKSLLSLGNVINSLTQNKSSHIPYRDSKLTRLLQESLGGNSKTNMIINVSPSNLNEQETLSSLRFGNRAKQIKNKPKVNRQYTVAELLLLLEKAQKKIQELEQLISEMSLKKMKSTVKTSQKFVQNLLDSDHPILESQAEQKPKLKSRQSQKQRSKIKLHFESQFLDSQDQTFRKQKKNQLIQQLQLKKNNENETDRFTETQRQKEDEASIMKQKMQEQKQILAEEIQLLNIEKVQICREFDILQEKYDITLKENRVNQSKINYLSKENEKLLQKLVNESSLVQQHRFRIQELQEKVGLYEQKILNIVALQKRQSSMSKVFGSPNSEMIEETKKIAQIVRINKSRQNFSELMSLEQKIENQIEMNQNKDKLIKELEEKNKKLNEQISLYKNLELVKQSFIQQKLKFNTERERLYKDLENRIEKVLSLEEKLDEEIQKRKYFQELIKSEESEKNRKILNLQRHLNQISENYYVLKGQQSSWNKDTKRVQVKLQTKNKRIIALEKEVMTLKEQVENLKMQIEQFEFAPKQESVLDLDLSLHEEIQGFSSRNKIVKVLKSSSFYPPQDFSH